MAGTRKRRPVIAFALLALAIPLVAEIHLGVKGGLGFCRLSFARKGGEEWSALTMPRGGLCAELRLAGPVALQAEALWASKGGQLEGTWGGLPLRITFRIDYVELPLLLKVYFSRTGRLQPAVYGGGYYAPRLNARLTMEYNGERAVDDIGPVVRSSDLGLLAGAVLELRAGPGRLVLDARLQMGLTELRGLPSASARVSHQVLSLLLGYWF